MRKTSVHDMRLIVCHDGAANVTNSEFNLNHVTAGRPTIATYKQKHCHFYGPIHKNNTHITLWHIWPGKKGSVMEGQLFISLSA